MQTVQCAHCHGERFKGACEYLRLQIYKRYVDEKSFCFVGVRSREAASVKPIPKLVFKEAA